MHKVFLIIIVFSSCPNLWAGAASEISDYSPGKELGASNNKKFHESDGRADRYFPRGLREISVIVTDHGYYPDRISIFEGEEVRFFVTSTKKTASCFTLKEKNVFLSALSGSVNEALVSFDVLGEIEYFCPSEKFKGKITVLPRSKAPGAVAGRGIASVPSKISDDNSNDEYRDGPSFWLPRDE
ncbi:MAG: hypothetical protein HOE90_01100 [Bacteriovoracaceae bacterium]|jgi:plastocyanin domain-containing protein|nr:hypothetical protein [Bacteriovoracaceae bacterium]